MSNCIDIHHGSHILRFSPKTLDVETFISRCEDIEAVVKGTNDVPARAEQALNEDQDDINWWWYLSSNSKVSDSGWLTVRLAEGRSSHTNRDFKWVMQEICKYLLKPKTFVLHITDEGDGHIQLYREVYKLTPNLEKIEPTA